MSGILLSTRQLETPAFNHKYLPLLKQYFEHNAYPSESEKASLAERTGMIQRQIHVWFQNHRNRAKKYGRPLRRPLDGGMSARLATNGINMNNAISPQRVYSPLVSSDTTTANAENHQPELNNYQGTGDPPYLKNYRQLLHSYVGKHRLGELVYEDRDQRSPSGMHIWISTVQLNGKTYGQRQGSTKGNARERAAADALAALQHEYNL